MKKKFDKLTFDLKYPLLEENILPVGFSSVPEFWNGAISDDFEAWFSTQRERNDISPGEEKGGFQLMSRGMPSIRVFSVHPFFDVDELYPSEYEVSDAESLFTKIAEDRKQIAFHGNIIGPKAPPTTFITFDFLDILI